MAKIYIPPGLKTLWNGQNKFAPGTYNFEDSNTAYPSHNARYRMGQTSFYRYAYDMESLVHFFLELPPETLNILSAPCSIGCEPYSFAMIALSEGLYKHHEVNIDAVDLSKSFTDAARQGEYPFQMLDEVFPSLQQFRHFHFDDLGIARMSDRMKSRVNFLPPTDICTFESKKNYDAMLMFNLLCKLEKKQAQRLVKTLNDMRPSVLLLNQMRYTVRGDGVQLNPVWPVVDRGLKAAGYQILDLDTHELIASHRNSLLKTNDKFNEGSRTMVLGHPEKLSKLGL